MSGGLKVLVTGGAGFIGSHLVEALVQRGHRVRVLDNLCSGRMENLEGVRRRIEFVRGDIRDQRTLQTVMRGRDLVFHQAALRSVPRSVADPLGYHEVNATATLELLWAARNAGVRRVVYASSSSVYGDCTPLPKREAMKPAPQSPYACSKLAGEIQCVMFSHLYGLQTVALRYFNVFGPRQSLESEYAVVIPKFITALLSGNPPPIHGDGLQSRDFTYVDNVVQANLRAVFTRRAAGEVFNVACGKRVSVRGLARLLCREMKVRIAPEFLPPRPGDVRHTWADISKARRLLGYRVEVPFEEGLSRTIRWFDRNRRFWSDGSSS